MVLIFIHAQASFSEQARALTLINPSTSVEESIFLSFLGTIYEMLSVWRIPILFVVAGMAAKFSLENRTLSQFSLERFTRIGIPLIFGSVVVFSIAIYLSKQHYRGLGSYIISPGHLWFLVNILIYAGILVGLLWVIKATRLSFKNPAGWFKKPLSFVAVAAIVLMAVAAIYDPERLGKWYGGDHTLLFGLICFIAGYVFAKSGDVFRDWTEKNLYLFGFLSSALLVTRFIYIGHGFGIEHLEISHRLFAALSALEAASWIITILGLAAKFVKKPPRWLSYATLAIFPVYIIHYPIQNMLAIVIQDIYLSKPLIFIILILMELIICIIFYEAIKKIKWFRGLFGLRP